MEQKPLFGDLIATHEGLADELKAVDVAAAAQPWDTQATPCGPK